MALGPCEPAPRLATLTGWRRAFIPVARLGWLLAVTAVAAGADHTLARRADGTVWAWGFNIDGELGDGSTTSSATPVQVSGLTDVSLVAGGWQHSLAVRSDGTAWAWGDNESGQ